VLRRCRENDYQVDIGMIDQVVDGLHDVFDAVLACDIRRHALALAIHRGDFILRQQLKHTQVPVLCPVAHANQPNSYRGTWSS